MFKICETLERLQQVCLCQLFTFLLISMLLVKNCYHFYARRLRNHTVNIYFWVSLIYVTGVYSVYHSMINFSHIPNLWFIKTSGILWKCKSTRYTQKCWNFENLFYCTNKYFKSWTSHNTTGCKTLLVLIDMK